MFRLWGKIIQKNNIVQNYVFEINKNDQSFDVLLAKGMEDLCNRFDISNPMWLSDNTIDMNRINKTKFKAQHFIEEIEFDYFEIEYLPERENNFHDKM
ncbi:hypothetical protein QE109_14505 [Fusibacter bizertensis]|uniref:Uncharacterized protein n=1 Tax=Fusibacter bizertensis TaxID=1488331 RepID=A0ABT6NG21_9FIRM|nr:hypothetical protein [Fusibacter bizertensis]MDH8679366.1 hypothetical protein [Fusibacter bizertensis]